MQGGSDELSFSFPGKVSGSDRLGVAGPRIAHRAARSPMLSLRLLDGADGLIPVVNCQPGCVTVVEPPAFREALLSQQPKLAIRDMSREVLISEFHISGRSRSVWLSRTAADVVRGSGAPSELVERILSAIGLEECANRPLKEIGECGIARLAIIFALYSKAKYVLLDKPFASLAARWVEEMGELIVKAVHDSNRFFIVVGSEKLPKAWRATDLVQLIPATDDGAAGQNAGQALSNLRDLVQSNHQAAKEEDHVLLTRPQTFSKPPVRAGVPEELKTEAIQNPKLATLLDAGEPSTPAQSQTRRKRAGTGTLTRVSKFHSLVRWLRPTAPFSRLLKHKMPVVELVTARSAGDEMTTQVRINDTIRRRRLRFVLILALAIAAYGVWLLTR